MSRKNGSIIVVNYSNLIFSLNSFKIWRISILSIYKIITIFHFLICNLVVVKLFLSKSVQNPYIPKHKKMMLFHTRGLLFKWQDYDFSQTSCLPGVPRPRLQQGQNSLPSERRTMITIPQLSLATVPNPNGGDLFEPYFWKN